MDLAQADVVSREDGGRADANLLHAVMSIALDAIAGHRPDIAQAVMREALLMVDPKVGDRAGRIRAGAALDVLSLADLEALTRIRDAAWDERRAEGSQEYSAKRPQARLCSCRKILVGYNAWHNHRQRHPGHTQIVTRGEVQP